MSWIDDHIRNVPDFPKPGILFKDITPLVQNAEALMRSVDEMSTLFPAEAYDQLLGIEARGFIFGAAMGYKLGRGCTLVRKKGKLPADTIEHSYALEYGEATVEMHTDGLRAGQQVLIVDDLLATGGTVAAAAALARQAGAEVIGAVFLVELGFLSGAEKLDFPVKALRTY
jgi:adenine phosphoribosyltransferase